MEMPVIASKAVLALLAVTIGVLGVGGAVATQSVDDTASHSHSPAVVTTVAAAANACGLVTPEEVTAAFGGNAGAPHFVLNTCVYDNGAHELIVALARNNAKTQYNAGRVSSAQDVHGIGDNAYSWNGRLAVLKGSSVMLITLVPGPASGVSPAALALARAAVTRL